MATSIAPTYVGLDVHASSIAVALLPPESELFQQQTIPNTPEAVRKLVRSWRDPTRIRACYEAGPCG